MSKFEFGADGEYYLSVCDCALFVCLFVFVELRRRVRRRLSVEQTESITCQGLRSITAPYSYSQQNKIPILACNKNNHESK